MTERSEPVRIAGRTLERSTSDFENACLVLIDEEQRKLDTNNAVVATLCDAVRLLREYYDMTNFHQARCRQAEHLKTTNRALIETLDRLLTTLSRVSVAADESTGIDLAYAVDHARVTLKQAKGESDEKLYLFGETTVETYPPEAAESGGVFERGIKGESDDKD